MVTPEIDRDLRSANKITIFRFENERPIEAVDVSLLHLLSGAVIDDSDSTDGPLTIGKYGQPFLTLDEPPREEAPCAVEYDGLSRTVSLLWADGTWQKVRSVPVPENSSPVVGTERVELLQERERLCELITRYQFRCAKARQHSPARDRHETCLFHRRGRIS